MEKIIQAIIASYNQISDVTLKGLKGVRISKDNLVCDAVLDGYSIWSNDEEVYIESTVLRLMFQTIW